jgi:hypothetical protein
MNFWNDCEEWLWVLPIINKYRVEITNFKMWKKTHVNHLCFRTTTCDITTCDSRVKLEQPHVMLPHQTYVIHMWCCKFNMELNCYGF